MRAFLCGCLLLPFGARALSILLIGLIKITHTYTRVLIDSFTCPLPLVDDDDICFHSISFELEHSFWRVSVYVNFLVSKMELEPFSSIQTH